MNTYENISAELKAYFSNHSIFKILLPLDMVLVFGSVGILILGLFISMGGFVHTLAYYVFLLGLLLTYANRNEKTLYLGFFIYAGIYVWYFIKNIIFVSYRHVDFSSLLVAAIFGGLGYLVFKRHSLSTGA